MLAVVGMRQVLAEGFGLQVQDLPRACRTKDGIRLAVGIVDEVAVAARQAHQLVGRVLVI